MTSAQDYPVSFGYKEQDGYYYGPSGIVGLYHKGNDRSTPSGTPILINGTDIGNTGATGLVSGPHLHTQAGTDIACQNTINPSPLEFQPGLVVTVGNGSQWGNYITIKVSDKYITYCHLSWVNVIKGQLIGEDMSKMDFALALKEAEAQWGWDKRSDERDMILKRDIVGRETNEAVDFMYRHNWGITWRDYRNNLNIFWRDWHDKIAKGEPINDPDYTEAVKKLEELEALIKK